MSNDRSAQSGPYVVECRNTPLSPQMLSQLTEKRLALARDEVLGVNLPIMFPADAYATVFLQQPDVVIHRALNSLIKAERRRVVRAREKQEPYDVPGVIYAFWITGQPSNQIKIGKSMQEPKKRIAQWKSVLAPESTSTTTLPTSMDNTVNLLFAFKTQYNSLAERLIHTTLACEHLAKLKNASTGQDLTEFFQIDNIMLLRLFLLLCVRYADSLGHSITH